MNRFISIRTRRTANQTDWAFHAVIGSTGIWLIFLLILWIAYSVGFSYSNTLRTQCALASLQRVLSDMDVNQASYFAPQVSEAVRVNTLNKLRTVNTPNEAIGILEKLLTTHKIDRRLKQHALIALGKIGTQPAIDVIRRFENWAERRRLDSPSFDFGIQEWPIPDSQRRLIEPLTQYVDSDDVTWALFKWYGTYDIHRWYYWLTNRKSEGRWSTPVPLDIPYTDSKHYELWEESGKFALRTDDGMIVFDLQTQLKDTDLDGLTDMIEQQYSTDPQRTDTDSDGIPDGRDGNPLTAKHHWSELTEIRQAVFLIMFATCASHEPIFVNPKNSLGDQEYYGYPGVVLDFPVYGSGLGHISPGEPEPHASRYRVLVASEWVSRVYKVHLERIYGKWVVTEFRCVGIQ